MTQHPSSTVTTPLPCTQLDPLETYLQQIPGSGPREARHTVTRYDWTADSHPTLSSVFRHSGWNPVRRRVYASLRRTCQPLSRILAFASCGDAIRVQKSLDKPDTFRLAGSYCHDRWCTPCANERARLIAANVLDLAGNNRLRFLTLTLRADKSPLSRRIDRLRAAFVRLRRTSLWSRHVKAGIACLEAKHSESSDAWHVHYHVLFQGKYIPKQLLRETWYTITGDSHVIDIQLAKHRNQVTKYVCKYVSKPIDTSFIASDSLLDEAVQAMRGVRLADTFGAWRGKPLTAHDDTGNWADYAYLDTLILDALRGDSVARAVLRKISQPGLQAAQSAAESIQAASRDPPCSIAIPKQRQLWIDTWYE